MREWYEVQSNIPAGTHKILQTLNAAGHEAYLVGGCVRDFIRGVTPHDWDICTSALPEQVETCFPGHHIIETGLKHGTVTIVDSGEPYEVTTYRTDGVYSDGRRPDKVQFVSNLTEDLSRRDFTINAIAMDAAGGLQDPFSGVADIASGIVKCVGDPDKRFKEDGLRVMRALRFASVFGFSIEEQTAISIHKNRNMLACVAAERINVELCKLLVGNGAGDILCKYVDVLCEFWPELGAMVGMEQHNPWHCYDVWNHTVAAVGNAPNNVVLRLAMLLHDVGKPKCFSLDDNGIGHFYGHPAISAELATDMLRRLKFDNDTSKQVVELVANHDAELMPRGKTIRRWLNKLGEERFKQLLEVKRADCMGQSQELVQERLKQLDEIKSKSDEIIAQGQCFSLRDLAVDGGDVVAAGVKPGPDVGVALNTLMDRVIDGDIPNEREVLLNEISLK